jgi:hypothetical protein
MENRGFKKQQNGEITFQIEALEIALLTSMIEQIIALLTPLKDSENSDPLAQMVGIDQTAQKPDDDVVLRLLPDAYQNDKEASNEFRRFTERSLRELKVKRAQFVLENLPEPDKTISIKAKDFESWLTVLNDVRLALGTRVGISEVEDEENITGEEEIDHAKDIYSWLTWLQSNLLEEMNS